ncbi:MAG: hypothetical protein DMF65_08625 [Acidobacteria bacterium]|nr:MAG: hypothetical protein DMF65_08625 [Acidobacteriota bacterium]
MLSVRAKALRTSLFLLVALLVWVVALSRPSEQTRRNKSTAGRAEGLAAWQKVYSVLTHPRCINCHTATNYPQQGDDRHRHFANVVRGPEGQGVPGLNCATCHQTANADSTGVPGAQGWHLAPLSMAWQDRDDRVLSSAAVCRAVTDRSKNENLDGPGLLKHHAEAELVRWAWTPGRRIDGTTRTTPPLSHAEFVEATRRWVEAGRPCP